MLLRPDTGDFSIIGLYVGRIITVVGVVMLLPLGFALLWAEWAEAAAFGVAAGLAITVGRLAELLLEERRTAAWHHGMLIAALGWLMAPFFGALPFVMSGHYAGFIDAYFEAMSGFATAGLSVANDLDHLADSMNLWRHLLHFLGGQGLVLVVLSFFATGGGAVGMYVGEAREEKILPNVARTSRFIWRVSLAFGLAGSIALGLALVSAGVPLGEAALHAPLLFMAAFDTGGFTPQSSSLGFYHSAAVEAVASVLMVAGALSFALHYQLWHRRPGELLRNTEVRLLAGTVLGSFVVCAVGLVRSGAYTSVDALVRRGFFQIVSAHSGTGFQTVAGATLLSRWGTLAPAMVVVAMALGGMAGSTAGGIKGIRIAVAMKAVQQEIRRVIRPPGALTIETYHSGFRHILEPDVVRSAFLISSLYAVLYLAGSLTGLFYGYRFEQAFFESTSAAAAVGLTTGLTGPGMAVGLKVTYILEMWVGRLEFVAVFALFGYAWSAIRGRA